MTTVRAIYEDKVAAGLSRDPAQIKVVDRLDALPEALRKSSGRVSRLLSRTAAPRGVYLWGDVGRGKSMLVAMLVAACADIRPERRHFHEFMRDIHDALHRARQSDASDPIHAAADHVTAGASLLVLDELEITDIVDAMIVARVFERALDQGVTLVATSNRAPNGLYRDGFKRDVVLPFVRLIETRLDVIHLDGGTDYRRGTAMDQDLYILTSSDDDMDRFQDLWTRLPENAEPTYRLRENIVLAHKERAVRGTFDMLCKGPLAASDYLRLAQTCDVVFIESVPVIAERDHDAARRFILLIDTLYDGGCAVVVCAAALPENLYPVGDFASEFRRTVSRLYEMTGPHWPGRAGLK